MNILIFTTVFHPSIGGLEKQTLVLINEFLKRGNNVKVITMHFQKIAFVYGAPELKDVDIYDRPGFLKAIDLFLWCDTLYMPNLSLKGVWLLPFNPFKSWVISHNDFYLSDRLSFLIRVKLLLIKFASQNIAVSESVANYIGTPCTIINNCYDNDIFKIYNNEKKQYDFVFLGRLVSQKGCDLLIEACGGLKEPFTLNIIGDGPEKPKLEKLVQRLGLEEKIKFLGFIEGECLARTLNRHKVMVIPSVGEEGFGNVALEGMSCGCKIIAANAGGLIEAVDKFGKIFNMKDKDGLKALLEEELRESKRPGNQIVNMQLNSYLTEHTKETIALKYLQLFK